MCPRSSDPFCLVTYYIKWVTNSWTYRRREQNWNLIKTKYVSLRVGSTDSNIKPQKRSIIGFLKIRVFYDMKIFIFLEKIRFHKLDSMISQSVYGHWTGFEYLLTICEMPPTPKIRIHVWPMFLRFFFFKFPLVSQISFLPSFFLIEIVLFQNIGQLQYLVFRGVYSICSFRGPERDPTH